MKATLGLAWTVTMALVCLGVQVSAALPYSESRMMQDNSYLPLKRTKPSLSIVNPLDVLRQRIILEMARRQMRENTRQVELNKALLREIGKRSSNFYDGPEYPPYDYSYYDRKRYNQHVAPDPESNPILEDEIEEMMDSLLRNGGHLTLDDGTFPGKPQRVRSVNDPPADQKVHGNPTQTQPQQLSRMFESVPSDDRKPKDQQDQPLTNDSGSDGVQLGDGDGLPNNDSYMIPTNPSGGQPATALETTNDRATNDNDYRQQRFVYGMYKNRYAN
ncbi:uncharacterized protein LOC131212007 [Anopheles bellator]|uniref:uncharacterized protein LOC131212007 n=1 Tax=Anopheles bellator TaxID=139047 RepID=UPI002648E93A|nr:uncharacterized protein LOC131212007 [Anopheles bellator]